MPDQPNGGVSGAAGRDGTFDGEPARGRLRAIIAAAGPEVRIFTPGGIDLTERHAPIAAAVAALRLDRVLLAAEIDPADGRAGGCTVSDLLALEGRDWVMRAPAERKARLRALLARAAPRGPIRCADEQQAAGRPPCEVSPPARRERAERSSVLAGRIAARRRAAMQAGWQQLRRRGGT